MPRGPLDFSTLVLTFPVLAGWLVKLCDPE
jgi:hypothetical protein